MDKKTISLLPHDTLIVNVGRGPLVEYYAILEALNNNTIGGFASDVGVGHPTKPSEPWDPENELSKHPNTLFTPHVGGYFDISYGYHGSITETFIDYIECTVHNKPPHLWVNLP